MTRVVHCVGSLALRAGGPARTVTALTDGLMAEGDYSVVLLSQCHSSDEVIVASPLSRVDRRIAVSGTSLMLKAGWPLRNLLRTAIREVRPSLLHSHGIWNPAHHYLANASRRLGVPLLIHPRGMLESWALGYRGWKKRLALRVYQRRNLETATLFFATAAQEAESIRQLGLKQPIAVIPNGVKIAMSSSDEVLRKNVRQAPRTALFLSRIHPKKGLLNLIEAWSRIRPTDWCLQLAGPDEGGHLSEVMRRIQMLGLDASVDYVGEVEGDVKTALFENAELFILPSFSENFGVAVAEALAYGVPVITTHGTPWEGVIRNGCGWWVDPSVDPLTEALQMATNMNPVMLQAMGNKGQEYAQEFNWSKISSQTVDVYRWVLGQGSMPDCVVLD